jgi:hypothetical protein
MPDCTNDANRGVTIDDLAEALMLFNGRMLRPGMGPLFLSERCDLDGGWSDEYWPYATLPGVYVVYSETNKLVYIGKASCSSNLGARLGAHFKKAPDGTAIRPEGWGEAKYVRTVPVPRRFTFEAPAIEEYLLGKVKTTCNTRGQ